MTNFNKIEYYYSQFDEWNRLEQPEGMLEFEFVSDIIEKYLPANSVVLDLGGGPGRYTAALSVLGHKMYLADLSPDLIRIAKEKVKQFGKPENVIQLDVCNALDLSRYADGMFDAVLLFGPLYHLTSDVEIEACLSEVARILRKGGKIFAIYIPQISGLSGILERSFRAPEQVDSSALLKTLQEGVFNNRSKDGFQEGAYLKSSHILTHFSNSGFDQVLLRSIRGLGNKFERNIVSIKESSPDLYEVIMKVIEETATDSAVLESCGHALFVGVKH